MSTEYPPIKFDIYDGNQLVHSEIIADQSIKIGKLSSSHIRLDDDGISRMHSMVEVHGEGDVVIFDLGSTSGTWVNGEKIQRQPLNSGDRVNIGRFTLVVTMAQPKKAPSVSSPGAPATASQPAPNVPLFDSDDESPGAARVLEVIVMWGTTVTDVQHLSEDGEYLIGDGEEVNHYAPDEALPDTPFTLAERQGDLMIVHVPNGVPGEVMLDDQVFTLVELEAAGKLSGSGPNTKSLRLPPRGRCRLKIGGCIYLINSVPAAREVGPTPFLARLEGSLVIAIFSAAFLHFLLYAIILLIPKDARDLGLDAFDTDSRFLEFLNPPEDELEIQNREKEQKEGEEESAKAKEKEGKAGKKDEVEKNKSQAVEGPEDNTEIRLAKKQAEKDEAIEAATDVAADIESDMAADWAEDDVAMGNNLISARGNLDGGPEVGDAAGNGGWGTSGTGAGGGGTSLNSVGVGRIGTMGRGRGGKGTGYGDGQSRKVTRKARKPKIRLGRANVSGGLDMETVRRIINNKRKQFLFCYQSELQKNPNLKGKVKVKFKITPRGKVTFAKISEDTIKNSRVTSCIRKKTLGLIFPKAKRGGSTKVNYPFVFRGG